MAMSAELMELEVTQLLNTYLSEGGVTVARPRDGSGLSGKVETDSTPHSGRGRIESDCIVEDEFQVDPNQKMEVAEAADILRRIADDFATRPQTGTTEAVETKKRRTSLDVTLNEIKQLLDHEKFCKYMDSHLDSHDDSIRQMAQVFILTEGMAKLLSNVGESVMGIARNAAAYVTRRQSNWIAQNGGAVAAVRRQNIRQ